jgi:hypothetical protein
MEYLANPLRKNHSMPVKPEKKKITMADLANLKNMMKRFERHSAVTPEAAPDRQGGSTADRRAFMASTSSSSVSQHSEHSAANLDGLQASLDKQRTMRRSNSTRDIASVLNRSSDPLGSNSMHGGSTATILGAMQRNQLGSNSGFLKRSDHGKDPEDTHDTEGDDNKDALGANSSNGRLEYSSSTLMTRRSTARSTSENGSAVSAGPRSVHSLFSSSTLIRRKKSGDDSSVVSTATSGGKRRTRRLSMGSMGSRMPESPAPKTSTSENMRRHIRSNLSSTGTGPSTNLVELRSGLGLPSPSEKAKAATDVEQAVAASDNGTSSTTWGGALADLRRSVVSQRALMSASAHNDYDGPKTITRGVGRRSSIGGMALPPTTLAPMVKKRSSRSRSRGRSQSVQRSSKSTDESKSDESKSSKKKPRDRSESVQRSSKSTDESKRSESKSSKKKPRDRSESVQRIGKSTDKSKSDESKSSKKKPRARSESVQRIGKSTDKSKSSEGKSPTKSSEKKGRGRTSKSSDVPPETKASERKGRGRSRSVHGSGKSSSASSAVPPETKAPDKKARARSKSTQQQRRTSKTTKDQARQKYGYNEFDNDEAAKYEAETVEAAEKAAAENEAAGSALGRRRERSQSMSHRMITNQETKYEPEDAIKQAANSAVDRRRERSQSVSHRRPSLHGLGDATSTPEAEIPPVDFKDVSAFGTAVDHGGFPAWDDNMDESKAFSGAGETPAPTDFGAPAPWDDDPWAEEGGNFDQEAPAVTTKVETKPNVPAIINFGDSNDLFGSEQVGLGSSSGHSRGGGSASVHSGGGGSSGSGSGSVSSGRGIGMGKQRSLTNHMDTSFGGKASDGGSVSGRSRNNLQGIRRSNVVSAVGPNIGQAVLAVPATKRRSSMTGSGFGGFDTSDVKSVGFDDHFEDKADGEDCPVTSPVPPFAIAFAGKKVATQKVDAESSQGPAESGQPVPPPSVATLFAQKLDAAKKFDQARGGSQHLPKGDSDQVLVADAATEKLETANKLDEIKKMSQRLSMAEYGPDQARGGSERPLKRDSGTGIAGGGSERPLKGVSGKGIAERFQAAKKADEMRKASNAPKPTTASAFAAKLQAAQQNDSTASISFPSTKKSSESSASSPQKVHRRQSMEMAYSPRPGNTAKKMNGVRSNLKHLRRSSLV